MIPLVTKEMLCQYLEPLIYTDLNIDVIGEILFFMQHNNRDSVVIYRSTSIIYMVIYKGS